MSSLAISRTTGFTASAVDGKVTVFKEDTGGANGLMFGPDGRLYACQNGRKRIVAYARDGKESVIAEGVESNDLAVNARGEIYFTDPANKRVWFIDAGGNKRVVHEGIRLPERHSSLARPVFFDRERYRRTLDLVLPDCSPAARWPTASRSTGWRFPMKSSQACCAAAPTE